MIGEPHPQFRVEFPVREVAYACDTGQDTHIDDPTRTKASAPVKPIVVPKLVDLYPFPVVRRGYHQRHPVLCAQGLLRPDASD